MLAHLADINERDFRQPACQKNLWLVGFPALQNSTVVYWDAYKTMEGGIPSRRNTVGHLYFAKVLAVIKNVLSVDLKGGFESLHKIFKTFAYHGHSHAKKKLQI